MITFSENRTEISKAYAKAWGAIKAPKHNRKVKVKTKGGGEYEFHYTDLAGIFDAVREVLKENGIAIMQDTGSTKDENGKTHAIVQTTLLHESGEYMISERMTQPAPDDIQQFGGVLTYLRRYQLSAMLGLSTEADDDANGVVGNTTKPTAQGSNAAPPAAGNQKGASPKQQAMIRAKLKVVAETMDTTPETIYEQIQRKFKTTAQIEQLTATGASKIIEQLLELEEGKLL